MIFLGLGRCAGQGTVLAVGGECCLPFASFRFQKSGWRNEPGKQSGSSSPACSLPPQSRVFPRNLVPEEQCGSVNSTRGAPGRPDRPADSGS